MSTSTGTPSGGHVEIEWSYEPADLFEEPWTFRAADGRDEYGINHGTVVATLIGFGQGAALRERVDAAQAVLEGLFRGAQLIDCLPVTLKLGAVRAHPGDGTHFAVGFMEPFVLSIKGGRVDVLITDASGNVTRDSKRDRIDQKQSLAAQIARHHGDPTLRRMLRSFDTALQDADDELVHLYEIRDAACRRFGRDTDARAALGVGRGPWSSFGRLCDVEPLRQGRHRGRSTDSELRNAKPEELEEARAFARVLIERYLGHLERSEQVLPAQ